MKTLSHLQDTTKTTRQVLILCVTLTLSVLLSLTSFNSAKAADFSISPILIEKTVLPGSKFDFEFTVQAKSATKVSVQPYDMKQLPSGHMMFLKPEKKRKPKQPSAWVKLSKDSYRLFKNTSKLVKGQVKIPKKIAGTQLIAIMVEEIIPNSKKKGVKIKVRYAVILKIAVPTKHNERNKGKATAAHLLNLKNKQLVLAGDFQNLSKHDYLLTAKAEIRDQNRRLIEKVQLKTKSAWDRKDQASWVFPNAEVGLIGPLRKIKSPGTYNLSIRYQLGGSRQVYYKKQIVVTSAMLPRLSQSKVTKQSGGLKMVPQVVAVKFKKDHTSFSTFILQNEGDKEMQIQLPKAPKVTGKLSFQFIPAKVALKPGARKRVILKQYSPTGKAAGKKYIAQIQQGKGNVKVSGKALKFQIKTTVKP